MFTWVLVPALLSDIADGLIARIFHLQSKLGALLDSIGDTLLLFASAYGIWVFHPEIIEKHTAAGVVLIGAWLLCAAVAVSVLGNLEELVLLVLLPEWRSDVRGLLWVLRERRGGAAP